MGVLPRGAIRTLVMLAVNLIAVHGIFADAFVFTTIDGTATGINNAGQVVGFDNGHVFVRSANGAIDILDLQGSLRGFDGGGYANWPGTGLKINNQGQILFDNNIWNPDGTMVPVILPDPSSFISGFNDSLQITGFAFPGLTTNCHRANVCGFIGDIKGNATLFSAYFETWPLGINNNGQDVGQTQNLEKSFLRNADGTVDLFGPGFPDLSAAYAISDNGLIVGAYTDNFSHFAHGMLFQETNAGIMLLDQIDFPGAPYTYLTGVNDVGDIVGVFRGSNGSGSFVATPVPEPSSLILFSTVVLAGVLSYMGIRRRRSV